jgi:hypothetical protein
MIVRLFRYMRDQIGEPVSWWRTEELPDLTEADWRRVTARDFSVNDRYYVLMRGLKPIALDPAKRAEALLSLDVHIAYLCAQFGVGEGDAE